MTTNRAFIKAYRQDSAEPVPTPSASAVTRPATAASTTVHYVTAGAGPTISAYDALPRVASADTNASDLAVWPTCDSPFGRIDPPPRTAVSGKRPLSSFVAQHFHTSETSPVATPSARFEPATTVASFSWPSVCRALCQRCSPEFDRIAEGLLRRAQLGHSVIGVIGLFPNIGATTITLCLAARLASQKCRAIVVEGNFVAPRLANWLDAAPTAWWQDVLERNVPTADAVVHGVDDHLDVLPLDTRTSDAIGLVSSLQAFATAAALRSAYELVLVDLGAFFDPESQPVVLELVRNLRVDAVLAVAGGQAADPRDLNTIAGHLAQSDCELLGTIENRNAQPQAVPPKHAFARTQRSTCNQP